MIYELRTYWAAEGKLEALNKRFRDVTLGVFAKHNINVVGFWMPKEETEETGSLIYLLSFPSEEAMKAAWAGFRDDPDWVNGRAESEKDGKLVDHITSVVLNPTDYSPMK